MPHTWPSPPTDNEVMLYRYQKGGGGGGGGVITKEIVASHIQAPPAFCTEAKVAKGGAYLRDTTVHNEITPPHMTTIKLENSMGN